MIEARIICDSARVSYEGSEPGERSTWDEDRVLYHNLLDAHPINASPAEHQATPDYMSRGEGKRPSWVYPDEHSNFSGWRQYRKMT